MPLFQLLMRLISRLLEISCGNFEVFRDAEFGSLRVDSFVFERMSEGEIERWYSDSKLMSRGILSYSCYIFIVLYRKDTFFIWKICFKKALQ